MLSAERIFQCPNRYLFDPLTRLCQRAEKVIIVYIKNSSKSQKYQYIFICDVTWMTVVLFFKVRCPATAQFYNYLGPLLVQLEENQLDQFFSLPLTYQVPLIEPVRPILVLVLNQLDQFFSLPLTYQVPVPALNQLEPFSHSATHITGTGIEPVRTSSSASCTHIPGTPLLNQLEPVLQPPALTCQVLVLNQLDAVLQPATHIPGTGIEPVRTSFFSLPLTYQVPVLYQLEPVLQPVSHMPGAGTCIKPVRTRSSASHSHTRYPYYPVRTSSYSLPLTCQVLALNQLETVLQPTVYLSHGTREPV